MLKNRSRKLFALLGITVLLLITMFTRSSVALLSQNAISWFWTSDTNASAVTVGDVNADGATEIVTAGYYNDGMHWNAQLVVWNATNMAVEKVFTWNWNDTQIAAVAIGDVNGDGQVEIVTGGSYFDGVRWNAALVVFNGTTLAPLGVMTWYWTSNTQISSVALANITGGLGLEIVTGGAYFDGTRWNSQLVVFNGPTLNPTNVLPWFLTSDTFINSVAVANLTGGTSLSIVVAGSFFDNTRYNVQLVVLNASTLAWQTGFTWYWTGDTFVNSVGLANLTGGTSLSIVTGGSYFDGIRANAQVIMLNGSTLAWQNGFTWYTLSDTKINSIVIGNYSGSANLDVITGGTYSNGVQTYAQVVGLNGGTLAVQTMASWFTTSNTTANSVALGNFGFGNRVVAAGSNFDLIRSNAQLSIWG